MSDKTHEIWNHRFISRIIDSMADGVFTMDNEGNITSWNQSIERISAATRRKKRWRTSVIY